MPKRIQLKRTKGWRMPPNTVKVDRSTKWGNLYVVGEQYDANAGTPLRSINMQEIRDTEHAVSLYRAYLDRASRRKQFIPWIEPLHGKNLACWCAEDAEHCHADVLLEYANRD